MRSEIGTNVKIILEQNGLKQHHFAMVAGYDPKHFSDMVCGRKTIKDTDVRQIVSTFNSLMRKQITPNDLFGLPRVS